MARQIARSWEDRTPRRLRKKIEMRAPQAHSQACPLAFAWPNGARDGLNVAASAQNLRNMAKLIPMPILSAA